MRPHLIRLVRAIQQQRGAVCGRVENLVALEEIELMDSDEVGALDQISALNRIESKAQVRHGHGPGLLRVVDEISLRVIWRFFADDLDRVLISADGAVGAQAPEQGAYLVSGFRGEVRIERQTVVR